MDFEEFLPENVDASSFNEKTESNENSEKPEKINQNQVYDVITSKKPDWQQIIYELIASEQLDPWDIDIAVLTKSYFEKIAELEEKAISDSNESEVPDFYISSKVLLAAALLLRIKSEFLLNRYIKSIDEILFGRKQENKYVLEKIEIDDNELPLLIPKTPMPRLRRVTLDELMSALDKAINTETRRIKKEVAIKRAKLLSEVDFPTFHRTDLKERIRIFYAKILTSLKRADKKQAEKYLNKICYSDLAGKEKEEKLACFLPLLHLSNTKKLWLEQENHLEEIYVYLYEYFDKNRDKFAEDLQSEEEIEGEFENFVEMIEDGVAKNIKSAENDFSENIDDEILENEKISEEEEKEHIREEIIHDIEREEKEEKIDEATGFDDENQF